MSDVCRLFVKANLHLPLPVPYQDSEDLISDCPPPVLRHADTETTATGQGTGRGSIPMWRLEPVRYTLATRYFPDDASVLRCKVGFETGHQSRPRKYGVG
jgi:hypothetical protein